MASAKKKSKSQTPAKVTSSSLEEQMAKFLAEGGEIQQIPLGVSGQVATSGPRHITLGKRHQAAT
jgi:hypothetical protein